MSLQIPENTASLIKPLDAAPDGLVVKPLLEPAQQAIADDFQSLCELLATTQWDFREQLGFEIEGVLVASDGRPSFSAPHVLSNQTAPKSINLGGELISSNLECSPGPHPALHDVFQDLFLEMIAAQDAMQNAAAKSGNSIALCGTLPSYVENDFSSGVLTSQRASLMNQFLLDRRGGSFPLTLKSFDGTEMFAARPKSMAIEGITTSLQVQMSAAPDKLPALYNAALLAMGAVLAGAGNSPFVCDRKGWHESRIGLLQNGVTPERFFLSSGWAQNPEDLFRDIINFDVITPPDTSAPLMKDKDTDTQLKALKGHNGTVWKWVRPCLGEDEHGLPHMRLELRSLPAGPTIIDQAANAAMLVCLVHGLAIAHPEIHSQIDFADVLHNHEQAAKLGLLAPFVWIDGQKTTAKDLLLDILIPLARQTAREMNFNMTITHNDQTINLIDVFERRVSSGQTGSQWAFDSLEKLESLGIDRPTSLRVITQRLIANQQDPLLEISRWPLASA